MAKNPCADELARELAAARVELRRAAQVLHDDVGSLLAVAGLRLQLLRMDHPELAQPELAQRTSEVSEALDGVMQHLRTLSRELEPTPVRRTGLKNALLDLAEARMQETGADVALRYTATATLAPAAADAMYQAIDAALASAVASVPAKARRVTLSVSGSRSLTARIGYAGRPKLRTTSLAAAGLLAGHAGLQFDVQVTKSGTIVSIRHANHRSSRG
jgi:signal transduction histidine kinase